MSDKLTEMALDWNADGCDRNRIIDNVTDEIMYDILEQYEIDLSDREEAKLEMLLRGIVIENINWDRIDYLNQEARDYEDAKRSAIYG